MYIFITIAVLSLVVISVSCESTREPTKEIQQKTTIKTPVNEAPTSASSNQSNTSGTLRANPKSQLNNQPQVWDRDNARYKILLRAPQSLTKLAKTLSLGFDPSFSKDYFEPFERRPRPVTLVAFRKNGFASRSVIKYGDSKSAEIAELQSPYNEVSNFWLNNQQDA